MRWMPLDLEPRLDAGDGDDLRVRTNSRKDDAITGDALRFAHGRSRRAPHGALGPFAAVRGMLCSCRALHSRLKAVGDRAAGVGSGTPTQTAAATISPPKTASPHGPGRPGVLGGEEPGDPERL